MSLSTSESSLSEVPTSGSNPNSNDSSPRCQEQQNKPPTYTYTREELRSIASSMGLEPKTPNIVTSIGPLSDPFASSFLSDNCPAAVTYTNVTQHPTSNLFTARRQSAKPPARQHQQYHGSQNSNSRSYQTAPRQHQYQTLSADDGGAFKQKTPLELLLAQLAQQDSQFDHHRPRTYYNHPQSGSASGPSKNQPVSLPATQDKFDFKSLIEEIDKKTPLAPNDVYTQTRSTQMAPTQGLSNSVADFFRKAQPYCNSSHLLSHLDSDKVLSVSKLEEELLTASKDE